MFKKHRLICSIVDTYSNWVEFLPIYDVAIMFTIGPLLNVKLIKTKEYTVQILLRAQSQKKAKTIVDFLDLINSLTQSWP